MIWTPIESKSDLPKEMLQFKEMHSSFSRLSVFYGLIFVVIKGYIELDFANEGVDLLLTNESFCRCMRLFRNATFHYQKQAIPEKAKIIRFLNIIEKLQV
ncbi:hypothetical protein MT390_11295 [Vibrio sp. 2-Bac 85]